MCFPTAKWFPDFGSVDSPGKLNPIEAVELTGTVSDMLMRLFLMDPFQKPGQCMKVGMVGNVITVTPVVFEAA